MGAPSLLLAILLSQGDLAARYPYDLCRLSHSRCERAHNLLSEGRRADRDHRIRWLHCGIAGCNCVMTRPENLQPAKQLALERVHVTHNLGTSPRMT